MLEQERKSPWREDDPRVVLEDIKLRFTGTLGDFVNSRTDKTQFVIACLEHQARLDSLMNLLCELHDGLTIDEAAEMVESERNRTAVALGLSTIPALEPFDGHAAGD